MSHNQYISEAGTSKCKKLLEWRPSTSSHIGTEKSSQNEEDFGRKAEIEQIEGRLRVLEEEGEMLKGAFLKSVEERTKLMNEICEKFETIQRGHFDAHGAHLISLLKDRRAGLLQVLCQDSNPTLVNRGFRANDLLGYDSS